MAISATRVAAFEFLIQFRSAGRGQLRNATNSFRRIRRESRGVSLSLAQLSSQTAAYRRSLEAQGVSTNRARELTAQYRRELVRTSRQARALAIRQRQQSIQRFTNGRAGNIVGRLLGTRAQSNFGVGIAGISSNIAKLGRVLGPVGLALSAFFGVVRAGIGLLASWARANAIILGGIGLLAAGITKLADTFSILTNRIRVAGDGTATVAETTLKLRNIARESRTDFSNIAELYGRISINAKELGVTQEEVLKVTELTAKAFKIAGITSREESQTIIQFAQALGSNRLSGDELRAVREQAPELSQALARGLTQLGKFGNVTVGTLKELGEQGVLTTRVITDALLQQERVINARVGRIRPKVSEGIDSLKSSLFLFFGTITESLNIGPRLFKVFDGIALRFDRLNKSSGRVALAIKRLPKLFRLLGLNGLNPVLKTIRSIVSFFERLPDKILNIANSINSFVSQVENGVDVKIAAEAAFGESFADVRRIFEPFSNVSGAFVTQLTAFKDAVVTISNALIGLARIIDDVAFIIKNILKFGGPAAIAVTGIRAGFDAFPRNDQ